MWPNWKLNLNIENIANFKKIWIIVSVLDSIYVHAFQKQISFLYTMGTKGACLSLWWKVLVSQNNFILCRIIKKINKWQVSTLKWDETNLSHIKSQLYSGLNWYELKGGNVLVIFLLNLEINANRGIKKLFF
jgi:hypothetical protein